MCWLEGQNDALVIAHGDIIIWIRFLHCWPFVWGIHQSKICSGNGKACCMKASSHYPNQCWLILSKILRNQSHQMFWWNIPRPWCKIKMLFYQHSKSHYGDKTVTRTWYSHNGISFIGKTPFLYWISTLLLTHWRLNKIAEIFIYNICIFFDAPFRILNKMP